MVGWPLLKSPSQIFLVGPGNIEMEQWHSGEKGVTVHPWACYSRSFGPSRSVFLSLSLFAWLPKDNDRAMGRIFAGTAKLIV